MATQEPFPKLSFTGTDRRGRGVGVRNRVLVLPSVICSHIVSERIADAVPGAVSAPHDHGCAQLGEDNDQTARTLAGVGRNPNIAGTLVVGLGCEEVQSGNVATALADSGVPVEELSIQGVGGTDECIAEGETRAQKLADRRAEEGDTDATLADLTVGIITSDLQPESRDVADPLVGDLTRRVIDAGGQVLVSGTERLAPHADSVDEFSTDTAAGEVMRVLNGHRSMPARDSSTYRTAGECSLETVTRTHGSEPIDEVVKYGCRMTVRSGLGLLDGPSRFEEAATGLAAAGAQVVIHVTADGIPTGHPIVPVIKVTGDAATAAALPNDIDVDATRTSADELVTKLAAVAGGERTCAERHGLSEFAITRVGPSM